MGYLKNSAKQELMSNLLINLNVPNLETLGLKFEFLSNDIKHILLEII
jgi:hypothetical protein